MSRVYIDGITATDAEGRTNVSRENAKLAYILMARKALIGTRKQSNGEPVDQPVTDPPKVWLDDKGMMQTPSEEQIAIHNYLETWINNLHGSLANLGAGVASTRNRGTTSLEVEANLYADRVTNSENMTNNKPGAKNVSMYDSNTIKIGPFNYSFGGTECGLYVSGTTSGDDFVAVSHTNPTVPIQSGSDFYILLPIQTVKEKSWSKIRRVRIKTNAGEVYTVTINFFLTQTDYQNLIWVERGGKITKIVDRSFDFDIPLIGNLGLQKVNADDSSVKLDNVTFNLKRSYTDEKGVQHVENIGNYITDSEGKIRIENLIVGDYTLTELSNKHYGYQLWPDSVTITLNAGENSKQLTNKEVYTKISGYVWDDGTSGKDQLDNHYNNGNPDNIFKNGNVIVRLKNKDGTLATLYNGDTNSPEFGTNLGTTGSTKRTDGNGSYLFEGVAIKDILDDNLYIEFEYDGLIYKTVKVDLEASNGSKADENSNDRNNFNMKFQEVQNSGNGNSTSKTVGNKKIDYDTTVTQDGSFSIMKDDFDKEKEAIAKDASGEYNYNIKADTNEGKYSIKNNFYYGLEKMENINLGLYHRQHPEAIVEKDLTSAILTINGETHRYDYAQSKSSTTALNESKINPGDTSTIKSIFADKFKGTYTRQVYESDVKYIDSADARRNLKIYLIYKIRVSNTLTGLDLKINNMVDYYDSKYTFEQAGTSLDSKGYVNTSINSKVISNETSNGYNKIKLDTTNLIGTIDSGSAKEFYVQFEVNPEDYNNSTKTTSTEDGVTTIESIIKNNEETQNIAEISSYSVYQDGKAYAGIDITSAPENTTPGKPETYEPDTGKAWNFKLEYKKSEDVPENVPEKRSVDGTVYEDNPIFSENADKIHPEKERKGNGEYDSGETGVGGVGITLKEERTADELNYRNIVYGDVDGNGVIDEQDAELALSHSVEEITLTGDAFKRADVTGDGIVNSSDASLISSYIKNKFEFTAQTNTKTLDKNAVAESTIIKATTVYEDGDYDVYIYDDTSKSYEYITPTKDSLTEGHKYIIKLVKGSEISGENQNNKITTVSLQKGDYYIPYYIPGNYKLTYTWGDKHYTVQDYKSTIVKQEVWEDNNKNLNWAQYYAYTYQNKNNENDITKNPNGLFKDPSKYQIKRITEDEYNKLADKTNYIVDRFSDALDNFDDVNRDNGTDTDVITRKSIDAEITSVSEGATITEENLKSGEIALTDGGNGNENGKNQNSKAYKLNNLDATTQKMKFGLEYDDVTSKENNGNNTNGTQAEKTYGYTHIDLGLVERPMQAMRIEKQVKHVKIELANGQVLVDAEADENGKISSKYLKCIQPEYERVYDKKYDGKDFIKTQGQIIVEMDNEIMQNALVTITYKIEVKNKSELDYTGENYYNYGTGGIDDEAVTQQATGIYDYLTKQMQYNNDETKVLTQDNSGNNANIWNLIEESTYTGETQQNTTEGSSSTTSYNDTILTSLDRAGTEITEWPESFDGTAILKWHWWYNDTLIKNLQTSTSQITNVTEYQKFISKQRKYESINSSIYQYKKELTKPIKSGDSNVITMVANKKLSSSSDEISLDNKAELVEVITTKEFGRSVTSFNVSENEDRLKYFYTGGYEFEIIPNTGENRDYVQYIAIGLVSFTILVTGIIIIKKKITK